MNKISVNILGHTYDVEVARGEELWLSPLAEYVEKKMSEIQRDTGIVDTQRLAVLAALNIADEFFRLRDTKKSNSGILDKKAEELIRVLDTALSA